MKLRIYKEVSKAESIGREGRGIMLITNRYMHVLDVVHRDHMHNVRTVAWIGNVKQLWEAWAGRYTTICASLESTDHSVKITFTEETHEDAPKRRTKATGRHK